MQHDITVSALIRATRSTVPSRALTVLTLYFLTLQVQSGRGVGLPAADGGNNGGANDASSDSRFPSLSLRHHGRG